MKSRVGQEIARPFQRATSGTLLQLAVDPPRTEATNNPPLLHHTFPPTMNTRILTTTLRSPVLTPTRNLTTARRLLQDPAKTKISSNYNAPPVPRRRNNDQLPVLPLVFIFVFGSGCFYYITKSRDGIGRPGGHQPIPDHTPESKKDWPRNTASDQTLSRR